MSHMITDMVELTRVRLGNGIAINPVPTCGLFIAKEIITAHGGTIEVHSSDADGTTFTARLPASIPPTGRQRGGAT
jgi:signal transduction histidine kinase